MIALCYRRLISVHPPYFAELGTVFRAVMKQHNLAPGDFPDLEAFRIKLQDTNFTRFPKLKPKMLEDLDEVRRKICRKNRIGVLMVDLLWLLLTAGRWFFISGNVAQVSEKLSWYV